MRGILISLLLAGLVAGCATPATTATQDWAAGPRAIAAGNSSIELAAEGACLGVTKDDCTLFYPGWGQLVLTATTTGTLTATWNATNDEWRQLDVSVWPHQDPVVGPYTLPDQAVAGGSGPSPLKVDLHDIPAGEYVVKVHPAGRATGPAKQTIAWVLTTSSR